MNIEYLWSIGFEHSFDGFFERSITFIDWEFVLDGIIDEHFKIN